MAILYALVARGTVILSEFTATSTNASTIAKQILEKVSGNNDSNVSYSQDRYVFHVKRTDGLTVLCMAEETAGRRIPFAFLEDIHQRFVRTYGRAVHTAQAYAMNDEFSRVLSQQIDYYSNDPNADRINRIQGEMSQVRDVMIENIDKVLHRGERLELLVDKTANMQENTFRFRKQARRFRKNVAGKPDDSEYEISEGESESVLAAGTIPWMSSSTLKLRNRIGRGPFGDVWLATHHQSTEDYDEHHEVAIKMLHPIKEDQRRVVVDKFEDLFSKCQAMENVCLLRGVSSISGKICIIMKFYEGSVGDKMARLKGGKLSLPDVLRYGVDLATGILELHSKGFLILNLKPSNFLLSDNDKAILGDVGIPYLLLSIPLPSSDMTVRLGTPNYMAPEQWQPEVRGPMSFETDSWGFGCSIVEMLTGVQPWSGRSANEIYDLVVRKQEKLNIPNGILPPLENLLRGCFMYDIRSRPSMTDILHVLKSLQNSEEEEVWRGIDSREIQKSSATLGYTEWFLSKDHLQMSDTVRSRKPANSYKHANMDVPEGMVVGLERDTTDPDGFALVKVHGVHDPLRVHVSVLERVTNGLASGDWVRLKDGEDKRHSPVGVLHSIDREGNVAVGFIGLPILWKGTSSQLQMAKAYSVGQFVKVKANVVIPRFKWMRKSRGIWATGRISWVLPNGCLEVDFPGVLPFGEEHGSCLADPAEVEIVNFNTCQGVVKKYQHLEDFHWAVRPLLIAMGLVTVMKLGLFTGKKIGRSKDGKQRDGSSGQGDCQNLDGQDSGKSKWLVFSV